MSNGTGCEGFNFSLFFANRLINENFVFKDCGRASAAIDLRIVGGIPAVSSNPKYNDKIVRNQS